MTIDKGNQVTLDVNQLTDKEVTVKWSQIFSDRSQQYYIEVKGSCRGSEGAVFAGIE